jgi:hypothetical protein
LDQSHFYSNGQRSALKSFQKDIQRFLGSFEFQAIANVIIWHEHAMVYAAIPQLPDNLETMIVQALCKLVSSVGEEN